MIKIIKAGTRKTQECETCRCLFSYEDGDIKIDDGAVKYGFASSRKYINCPQCKKEIVLSQTR